MLLFSIGQYEIGKFFDNVLIWYVLPPPFLPFWYCCSLVNLGKKDLDGSDLHFLAEQHALVIVFVDSVLERNICFVLLVIKFCCMTVL